MDFREFKEIVLKRRTIRNFNKEKVNKEDIIKCIELGIWAPNGSNLQRMRFSIIDNEKLIEKVKLYAPGLSRSSYIILAIYSYENEEYNNKVENEIITYDIGLAMQNISLGLYLMGYGSCIIRSFNEVALNKLLYKEGHKLRIILSLGKPEKIPPPPPRKKISAYLV